MARQIQLRRGTTAQNDSFKGAVGEVTYDTELKTVRVHDNTTTGGIKLAKNDDVVHKDNVNESIDGYKTFQKGVTITDSLALKDTAHTVGTFAEDTYSDCLVAWKDSTNTRFAFVQPSFVTGDNITKIGLYAGNNALNSIQVGTNGITSAPTPTASNSSSETKIATTGWVNNSTLSTNVVHRSDNETINGKKTFTEEITGRFRTASCHQGDDNTNCWFKLGSFQSYGIYHNQIVIFRLWSGLNGDQGSVTGRIMTRTGGGGTAGTVNYAKIEFDTCPYWLSNDNFKLLYKENQGTNPDIYGLIELWVKTPNVYTGYCMSIQDERTSGEIYNTSWTFYNLPTGVASLPSGYTQSAPTYTANRQFGINTASVISRSLDTTYTATRNCWIFHNENTNNNSVFYIDGVKVYETDWHSGITFAKGSALIFVAKGQKWKASGGVEVKEFGTLTGD